MQETRLPNTAGGMGWGGDQGKFHRGTNNETESEEWIESSQEGRVRKQAPLTYIIIHSWTERAGVLRTGINSILTQGIPSNKYRLPQNQSSKKGMFLLLDALPSYLYTSPSLKIPFL